MENTYQINFPHEHSPVKTIVNSTNEPKPVIIWECRSCHTPLLTPIEPVGETE